MSGRPSMSGLIMLEGSTRDSAIEYGALTVAGVGAIWIGIERCPNQYDPPAITTTAAACASQREYCRVARGLNATTGASTSPIADRNRAFAEAGTSTSGSSPRLRQVSRYPDHSAPQVAQRSMC